MIRVTHCFLPTIWTLFMLPLSAWSPPVGAQTGAAPAAGGEQVERPIITSRERVESDGNTSPVDEQKLREAEERLRAAEARLAEAAREIAEITSGVIPGAVEYARELVHNARRPVLGVSIGSSRPAGEPVEGVEVLGVSPGSPAEAADVRAGDVITAIDGTPLSAASSEIANRRLLDSLSAREPGDAIALELLRDGDVLEAEVQTTESDTSAYGFFGDGKNFEFDFDAVAPQVWFGPARPWGDMELVELSAGLGRYFGTDSGLLVVRAPSDAALKLEDGDVIRSIGGREPGSVSHAMRILRSYEEGEELVLDILRDRRNRRLEVQIPASQGRLAPPVPPGGRPAMPAFPAALAERIIEPPEV